MGWAAWSPFLGYYGWAPPGRPYLIYIASTAGAGVMVVDPGKLTQVNTLNNGQSYSGICLANGKLYCTRPTAGLTDVLNPKTGAVIKTISTGTSPNGIVATPNGRKVYIATGSTGVVVVSTATDTVSSTITTGIVSVSYVSVNPAGTFVYASEAAASPNGHVRIIDTSTDAVVNSITLAANQGTNTPTAVNASGTQGFVGYAGHQSVSVLDLVGLTLLTTFPVSSTPIGFAELVKGSTIFSGGIAPLSIGSANGASSAETATLAGAGTIEGMALSPDGSSLLCTDASSANLRFISTTAPSIKHTVGLTTVGGGVCTG